MLHDDYSPSMKHVLSFSSAEASPKLFVRENGQETTLELAPGSGHRFSFSPTRVCVGYKTDEGWKSCSNSAVNVRQCPTCQYKDVARVYTVGDFSLYPHLHDKLEKEKYVLYLAQFGADLTKLGLTRRSRLMDRWKEQGADFGAAILEFDGPDDAYPAENLLQERFQVVGAIRASQKIRRIQFDKQKAQSRLQSMVNQVKADHSLCEFLADCNVVDMAERYPQISSPEIVDYIGGDILGAKGAWLFYAGPSGQHYAVDLHLKVGHFMMPPLENGMANAFL